MNTVEYPVAQNNIIFRPGIAFMHATNLPTKMVLIALVALLPMLVSGYLLWGGISGDHHLSVGLFSLGSILLVVYALTC
jgi:hypothetical protein